MDSSHTDRDVHTFYVTAADTDGCKLLGFKGGYRLRVGLAVLQLLQRSSDREVTHWPFHGIRNYGFSTHKFYLHAGTRCKTGEGQFIFSTREGSNITHCMRHQIEFLTNLHKKNHEETGNGETKTLSSQNLAGQANHRNANNECKEALHFSLLSSNKASQPVYQKMHRIETRDSPIRHDNPAGGKTTGYVQSGSNISENVNGRYSELPKVASIGNVADVFSPKLGQEEDYYNVDMYSHLNRNTSHIQESQYGMTSASPLFNISEEEEVLYVNTVESDYEYIS